MKKTTFEIPKMDCPSEENLIRLKLQDISEIKHLDFNLEKRKLIVFSSGEKEDSIAKALAELKLGSRIIASEAVEARHWEPKSQRKLLWIVLVINFAFFLIEISFGWLSGSMGLVADSLDMLADSAVYAISIAAVGGTIKKKKKIAGIAGYFQIILAILGFLEVIRRFFNTDEVPDYQTMMIVSAFALAANGLCLYLLQRSKSEEAHMKASMIFTSNDVIINLGVIAAALLVHWAQTNIPDLLIGGVVFFIVIRGAIKILQLSK